MQPERKYRHFCPLARALEQVGQRWGLLIVRDLLVAPQRFSDLMQSCAGITPRQLTARLRQLEEAGIVERDTADDRREVWYRLTTAGLGLKPTIESLLLWGLRHLGRPPANNEPVRAYHVLNGTRLALEANGVQPAYPLRWTFRFPSDPHTLHYDGSNWQLIRGPDAAADVLVDTTPRAWAQLVLAPVKARSATQLPSLHGRAARTRQFQKIFGLAHASASREAKECSAASDSTTPSRRRSGLVS